jgi:hypothetical protein
MDATRELVTVEQADRVIGVLAYALPIAGVVLAASIAAVRRRFGTGALAGLIAGLSGPAIWGLWRAYNGVIAAYGLDSVRGLVMNLALFVAIGLAVGLGVGLVWQRAGKVRRRRDSPLRSG